MRFAQCTAFCGLIAMALLYPRVALGNQDTSSAEVGRDTIDWMSDYYEAHTKAKETEKLLLVYFADPKSTSAAKQFEQITLKDEHIRQLSDKYVRVKVPTTTEIEHNGQKIRLLNHGAFAHLGGHEGLAIVDLKNQGQSYYGKPVGCLPFESSVYYSPDFWSAQSVRAFLDLPDGTITQRMLTFAIRLHPERPASCYGRCDKRLLNACARHSHHQASIQVQGHHNWDSRFHEIHQAVGGHPPVEVCAESWPGENLVHSCFSCVYAWRQSSGHWGAIRARQPAFGYDIKRGANGIWYATGIFGGSRPFEG